MSVWRGLLSEDASHLRVLTGLRGWAAVWVFLYHAWIYAPERVKLHLVGDYYLDLTPFLCIGGAGVSIFFVLSGFLLAQPFAAWQAGDRSKPDLSRYFIRRFLRVFPAYYAQLAILVLLAYFFSPQIGIGSLTALLQYLLMAFVPPPVGVSPINGVWWTLPIEFSFYLALPFLAYLLSPRRWLHLLVIGLLSMWAWRYVVILWLGDAPIPERVVASYQLPGSMDMFGIGMLAASLHANKNRLPDWIFSANNPDRLAALGLMLLVVAIYWLNEQGGDYWANNAIFYLWTPALSMGTVALVLSGINGSRLVNFLFGNNFMVFVGIISYSVYLWHFPLLSWLSDMSQFQAWQEGKLYMLLMVSFPLLIGVALLSYVLVERPFLIRRNR